MRCRSSSLSLVSDTKRKLVLVVSRASSSSSRETDKMLRATHICRLSRSLSPPPRRAFPLTSPFNSLVSRSSRVPTSRSTGGLTALVLRQHPPGRARESLTPIIRSASMLRSDAMGRGTDEVGIDAPRLPTRLVSASGVVKAVEVSLNSSRSTRRSRTSQLLRPFRALGKRLDALD
ncbi:hypothetical protein NBRC10513_007619 [Rhodotorula toruloides]